MKAQIRIHKEGILVHSLLHDPFAQMTQTTCRNLSLLLTWDLAEPRVCTLSLDLLPVVLLASHLSVFLSQMYTVVEHPTSSLLFTQASP
jgi:hypothetical protein